MCPKLGCSNVQDVAENHCYSLVRSKAARVLNRLHTGWLSRSDFDFEVIQLLKCISLKKENYDFDFQLNDSEWVYVVDTCLQS